MSVPRQLLVFFAIAFGFTWAVLGCMIVWHLRIEFSIVASLGPTLAALITNRLVHGHYRAFSFNVNWWRTLAASVLGVALMLAGEIVFPATATVDAGKLNWSIFLSAGLYNYSTLLGGPLFEEPGWRGFALPRLESCCGPLRASLLLGIIWSAWHLPAFLYPGWSECPIPTYFFIVTGLTVIMTFAANVARFGVIAPIVIHAMHNTSGRYFNGLFATASPGSGGFINDIIGLLPIGLQKDVALSFYTLIAIGSCLAAAVVIAFTKGRLGYSPESSPSSAPITAATSAPAA